MPSLKVLEKGDVGSVKSFEYYIDGAIVAKETYSGCSLFLSAMNKYALVDNGNLDSFTKWTITNTTSTIGGSSSNGTLGPDGIRYNFPFPTSFFERDAGTPGMMGGLVYAYTPITYTHGNPATPDVTVYVPAEMGSYRNLAQWKSLNIASGSTGGISVIKKAIREMTTGFELSLDKIGLELNELNEPPNLYNPTNIVELGYLIRYLFNSRIDRTATVNNTGDISW